MPAVWDEGGQGIERPGAVPVGKGRRVEPMSKDDFTVNPHISDIKINHEAGPGISFNVRCKLGMDAPIKDLIDWLDAGANIRVTLRDGSTAALKLERTVN